MRAHVPLILFVLAVIALPGSADTIVFDSGDRLEGRLQGLHESHVAFRSDIAGRVTAGRHRVRRLSVTRDDRTWELRISDGTVHRGNLRRLSEEEMTFQRAGAGLMCVELGRVQRLVPEPKEEKESPEKGRVYLENGDRITGEVARLESGTLTVDLEGGGTLSVALSRVRTFSTAGSAEIYLASGKSAESRLATAGPGRVRVESGVVPGGQVVELSELAGINFQPDKEPEWEGSISAGYAATRGNTRTQSSSFKMNLRKRWESARTKLRARYNRSSQERRRTGEEILTEQEFTGRGQYDYFFTDTRYLYGSLRYRRDRVANLDSRFLGSVGGGYQWVDTADLLFKTEAGVGMNYEDYADPSRTSRAFSAEAGYELEASVNDRLTLLNDWMISPSVGDISDYYMTTSAELRVSLTEAVYSNFELTVDYDSQPAQNTPKTDIAYILGTGVEF